MFKREIKPLAEGMAESISKSINRLQHIEEKASRPADSAEGDVKPQDISGEEEVKSDASAKKAPARKGDKAVSESYNESSCVGEMKKLHASSCSKMEMYKKVKEKYGVDKAKFEELYAQYCMETYKEDNTNDKSDDGEGLDKVQPKAVKKKFADRKDKDIDNDGDTDSSDEYLHKRRKAISKALESKKPKASVDESAELEGLLDEAATPQMQKAAASIQAYAKKHGGIDKADFMKAAKMLSSGNAGSNFIKFVDGLDTEPREWIITDLAKTMGKQTVEKMFKVKIREEVELDEKVNTKAIQKAVDDGKSMDAIMTMFANKRTTNTDEIRKVVKDYMWKKRMKKEEVELDEAAPKISKGKAKGSISATGLRGKGFKKYDVDVKVDNGKFSFRITDETGRFQTVGIKQAAKMLGEQTAWDLSQQVEDIDEAKKSDYTIYHKTFSSAVQHAAEVAKKRGYEVDDDNWDRKVAMGPRKPGKGKTNSYTIDLMKGGKPVKNKLQMQVYYDEGRYELNMYIS